MVSTGVCRFGDICKSMCEDGRDELKQNAWSQLLAAALRNSDFTEAASKAVLPV